MSAAEGTGLPLASRLYRSRTLGLTLGFVCVVFGMYPLDPAWWVWAWMLINAFVWPHVAFQLTRRSASALRSERRNLLFDSFCGGFWVGAMHFNPLPSVTTLSMMSMNNVAIGGPRFMLAGWVAQALGLGTALLIFTPAFIAVTTQAQLYACLPILMLYPLALGWICVRR
ncbi:UNVERIFIED_ORG: hypothetical protein J2Y94_003190 [Pseudomonas poae]